MLAIVHHRFADEQLRGPYRIRRHTHRFYESGGATNIDDVVACYRPSFETFGEIFPSLVRLQLKRITRKVGTNTTKGSE